MSIEVEFANLRKDVDHILEKLDARDKKDQARDERLDQLFEMFTVGKSLSSIFVRSCIAVGAVAGAAFFVVEKILPHITLR